MVGRRVVAALLLLLLPLAGCSSEDAPVDGSPPDGHWVLRAMSYDGTSYDDFIAELTWRRVTLRVEDGLVAGHGACNDYGQTAGSDGFPLDGVEQTLMGCVGDGTQEFDDDYFEALTEVTDVEVTDDGLVLTGEDLRLEYETRSAAR